MTDTDLQSKSRKLDLAVPMVSITAWSISTATCSPASTIRRHAAWAVLLDITAEWASQGIPRASPGAVGRVGSGRSATRPSAWSPWDDRGTAPSRTWDGTVRNRSKTTTRSGVWPWSTRLTALALVIAGADGHHRCWPPAPASARRRAPSCRPGHAPGLTDSSRPYAPWFVTGVGPRGTKTPAQGASHDGMSGRDHTCL